MRRALCRACLLALLGGLLVVGRIAAAPAVPGLPDYYPAEYARIVEASRGEGGLLVYSIMAARNWEPVIAEFRRLYPWIRVETLDLGSYEVFERYYAESASGARTADMIISIAPDAFQELVRRGQAVAYDSPEVRRIPSWARFGREVYLVSADPMVFIWNKRALREDLWPTSIAQLVDLVTSNPGRSATASRPTTPSGWRPALRSTGSGLSATASGGGGCWRRWAGPASGWRAAPAA
jgi:iron(III) transport system substrate-binding protein